jgi:hypothetical protein
MVRYVFKCFIAVIQASTLPLLIVGHLLTRREVVFVFWLNDHRSFIVSLEFPDLWWCIIQKYDVLSYVRVF